MKAPRLAIALLALGASLVPLASAAALTVPKAVALSLPNPNSGLNQGYLPFQSCSSVGNCAVAGIYLGARGFAAGVVDYEVKGIWKSPLHVRPPSGYSPAKGVTMDGVSCPSDANCVALGQYVDKTNQLPFTVSEVAGVWQKSATLALPQGAMSTSESATPHAITCESNGNCTVVGTYTTATTAFATQGFMVSEVHGLWHHAVTLSLPPGTNVNPLVSLTQVACWTPTSCVAAGSYVDANSVSHAVVVPEVGGVWEKALVVGLPGNASAFAGAQFNEVTCVAGGSCLAAGTYNTITGAVQPLVVLSVAGVWNRALEVNLPNAATNPETLFYGFKGVACANAGNCALGGQFLDKNGRYQGFFDNVVNGNVQRAQMLTPPAGAVQSGHNGGVVSISCPAVNACVAGAAYLDSANQYAALLVTEANGVWSNDSTISLPGSATTVGVAGGIYSVQCFTTTTCQVSGSYQSAPTRYDGFSLVTGV
jgi:hypothetical protein